LATGALSSAVNATAVMQANANASDIVFMFVVFELQVTTSRLNPSAEF
jgi:hypothetical protein